ncbi:MAG: MBL fold metallo-hydrolase [Puniceicoccales bacterium]|jgi:beta-lactamase superfamily II metal-dependent hydrolase|nr:MBL fold metallo-hydrolase [Puniceicoccales bacterium]
MFCRFILGYILCVFGSVWAVQKSTLEICFFDTGQGNLIAVRANNVDPKTDKITSKLIFVDCGSTLNKEKKYGEILRNEEDPRNQKLLELFKDIPEYGILITHNHKDHDNLMEIIEKVGKKDKKERNVWAVRPMSEKTFLKYKEDPVNDDAPSKDRALTEDWKNFCDDDLQHIENSLGPSVKIIPIRPERWERYGSKSQNREHDFNMMYLVRYEGRRMLFTGDVSPQLFMQIMRIPQYRREITAVDFWVLSHHGTNQAGELLRI